MEKVNLLKEAYKETKNKKKQRARMIKCSCLNCGYQVYTSRMQIGRAKPVCSVKECSLYLKDLEIHYK